MERLGQPGNDGSSDSTQGSSTAGYEADPLLHGNHTGLLGHLQELEGLQRVDLVVALSGIICIILFIVATITTCLLRERRELLKRHVSDIEVGHPPDTGCCTLLGLATRRLLGHLKPEQENTPAQRRMSQYILVQERKNSASFTSLLESPIDPRLLENHDSKTSNRSQNNNHMPAEKSTRRKSLGGGERRHTAAETSNVVRHWVSPPYSVRKSIISPAAKQRTNEQTEVASSAISPLLPSPVHITDY